MKTEEILNLDYRKEKDKEIIQKVLRKIKPLSKFSDDEEIPLEAIEKAIKVMVNKYEVIPQWVMMSFHEEDRCIYSISLKTTDDGKWIGNTYGICLYEVFAKLAIKMYSEIKLGNIAKK